MEVDAAVPTFNRTAKPQNLFQYPPLQHCPSRKTGLDVGTQIVIGGTEITVRDIEIIEREIKVENGKRCIRKETVMVSETELKSIDALQRDSYWYDSFMEYTRNKYGRQPGEIFEEENEGGSSSKDEQKGASVDENSNVGDEDNIASPATIDIDLGEDVIEVEVTEEEDEEDENQGQKEKEDKKFNSSSGKGTPTASLKKIHHRSVSRVYSDVLRPHSSFRRVGSILKRSGGSAVSFSTSAGWRVCP